MEERTISQLGKVGNEIFVSKANSIPMPWDPKNPKKWQLYYFEKPITAESIPIQKEKNINVNIERIEERIFLQARLIAISTINGFAFVARKFDGSKRRKYLFMLPYDPGSYKKN